MNDCIKTLIDSKLHAEYSGYTALDHYYNVQLRPYRLIFMNENLADVAKICDNLQFPGEDSIDAIVELEESVLEFKFEDHSETFCSVFSFGYDIHTGFYQDKSGIYPLLRSKSITGEHIQYHRDWRWIMELALLVGRFGFTYNGILEHENFPKVSVYEQKKLLSLILSGNTPDAGLDILMKSGFIDTHWPELSKMKNTEQSKEHHPEGNVWEHTLRMFQFAKKPSLPFLFSLLLHDSGKPVSDTVGSNRFHKHAQLGAAISEKFLRRLGFNGPFISDCTFIIRYHMVPDFINALSERELIRVCNDDMFPDVLELFRCDLLSAYQNEHKYYSAAKQLRRYRKNMNNPHRNVKGRIVAPKKR